MARVRRLAEPCRRMLDAAAVIGPRIGHRLLAHVSDLSEDHLDLAVAEAVATHLLVVDGDRRGYRFHHDLVREAVYSTLLPGERARVHHRVAAALTAYPELVPEELGWREAELATHWWEAGVWIEALPACAGCGNSRGRDVRLRRSAAQPDACASGLGSTRKRDSLVRGQGRSRCAVGAGRRRRLLRRLLATGHGARPTVDRGHRRAGRSEAQGHGLCAVGPLRFEWRFEGVTRRPRGGSKTAALGRTVVRAVADSLRAGLHFAGHVSYSKSAIQLPNGPSRCAAPSATARM